MKGFAMLKIGEVGCLLKSFIFTAQKIRYNVNKYERKIAMDFNKHDNYISDSGIITSNKKVHITFFVFLCRALTFILAVLGILAFVEGNF